MASEQRNRVNQTQPFGSADKLAQQTMSAAGMTVIPLGPAEEDAVELDITDQSTGPDNQ